MILSIGGLSESLDEHTCREMVLRPPFHLHWGARDVLNEKYYKLCVSARFR